jgi:hypothetical protein
MQPAPAGGVTRRAGTGLGGGTRGRVGERWWRERGRGKKCVFLAPKATNFSGAHPFPPPPAHTPLSPPARARRMSGNMKFKNASGLTSLLKDGYKHYGGLEEAILKNISACKQLAAITRTSLGPDGALRVSSAPPAAGGARAGERRGARRATNLPLNRSFGCFRVRALPAVCAPARPAAGLCAPRAHCALGTGTSVAAARPAYAATGPFRRPAPPKRPQPPPTHRFPFPPLPLPRARASPPAQA